MNTNYAAVKDAHFKLVREKFLRDMGQRAKYATEKDALMKLWKEKCA